MLEEDLVEKEGLSPQGQRALIKLVTSHPTVDQCFSDGRWQKETYFSVSSESRVHAGMHLDSAPV